MKAWIWMIGLALLASSVAAYYPFQNEAAQAVRFYSPRLAFQDSAEPLSVLRAWHEAQRTGGDLGSVRYIGRDYARIHLRLLKPLDVKKRWARDGYTSLYGIDRQVIVPWQPRP